MKILKQFTEIIIVTIFFSTIGYYYVPQFRIAIDQKIEWLLPCRNPITYSIGNFDNRFGIIKSDFINTISKSEGIWEKAINKDLFLYKENNGQVIINLNYDDRQESTDKLKKLGYIINSDKSTVDKLKLKYNSLKNEFDAAKAILERDIEILKREQADFERDVQYWNGHGGAPTKEYNELTSRKESINLKVKKINQRQDALNESVSTINSLGIVLNNLVTNLNLDVENYNQNQSSVGDEFDQGEYVLDRNGRHIDIFQYDDKDKLERVITHELGHSLGIQHNDNPKSIMYKINESKSLALSKEDLLSIKSVCNLE